MRQPGKTSQLSDCQRSLRRIRFYLSYWLKNDRELTWLASRATFWSSLVAEGCIWPLLFNVEPARLLKTLWTKKSLGRQAYLDPGQLDCRFQWSCPRLEVSSLGDRQFLPNGQHLAVEANCRWTVVSDGLSYVFSEETECLLGANLSLFVMKCFLNNYRIPQISEQLRADY